MSQFSSKIFSSIKDIIEEIGPAHWQQLFSTDYPFTRYQFLLALEQSESCHSKTGWLPQHIAIYAQKQLIAIIPCYLKNHSFGEYIFDWAWRDAYEEHDIEFYPKLTCAIPYTPATGPRIGIIADYQPQLDDIIEAFNQTLIQYTKLNQVSNWQLLFNQPELCNKMVEHKWLKRNNVQFHWLNRNYQSFDDFLALFTSRKRKSLRKERLAIKSKDIEIKRLQGEQITDALWQKFYLFYQVTYLKRSGHGGYLTLEFFLQLAQTMPEQLMMVVAYKNQEVVAASLYFQSKNTLYGRYWGCLETQDYLHFECCYYQGIEYCIEKGIQRFDAGAQGEHKIQRGFEPVETYANYYILDQRFAKAIAHYLQQEWQHNVEYLEQAKAKLPFKQVINPT